LPRASMLRLRMNAKSAGRAPPLTRAIRKQQGHRVFVDPLALFEESHAVQAFLDEAEFLIEGNGRDIAGEDLEFDAAKVLRFKGCLHWRRKGIRAC
jgi:hypothetical protein